MIVTPKSIVDIQKSRIEIDVEIRPDVDVQADIFQNLINGIKDTVILDLDPNYNESFKGHVKLRLRINSDPIDPPAKSADTILEEESAADKAKREKEEKPKDLEVWKPRPESLKEQKEIAEEKKKAEKERNKVEKKEEDKSPRLSK